MILLDYSNSMNYSIGENDFKQHDSDSHHSNRKTFPVRVVSMTFDWFMNDCDTPLDDSVMDTKGKSA
jgi:hypothetical protein